MAESPNDRRLPDDAWSIKEEMVHIVQCLMSFLGKEVEEAVAILEELRN